MSGNMSKQLVHVEWIGTRVKIVAAGNESLVGLEGRVIDETKAFLLVQTGRGERRVPKKGTTFQITIKHNTYAVSGDDFLTSPAEKQR